MERPMNPHSYAITLFRGQSQSQAASLNSVPSNKIVEMMEEMCFSNKENFPLIYVWEIRLKPLGKKRNNFLFSWETNGEWMKESEGNIVTLTSCGDMSHVDRNWRWWPGSQQQHGGSSSEGVEEEMIREKELRGFWVPMVWARGSLGSASGLYP